MCQQRGLPCWVGTGWVLSCRGGGPNPCTPTGQGTRTAPTLTEAQGLPADPHHPPQLPAGAGQQQVTGEPAKGGALSAGTPPTHPAAPKSVGTGGQHQHLPLLGLRIHHDGDVALDEREGKEGDGVEVLATSTGLLGGAEGRAG